MKYSLQDMKLAAKNKNGKCLSKVYLGMNLHLRWQCSCGNVFSTTPNKVIHRDQWCPKCGIIKRSKSLASSIEECREIALERKGKCLSPEYTNNSSPIKWECEQGHTWNASLKTVKASKGRKGTWCPTCFGKKPHDIAYARLIAKELGWRCTSKKYVNYNSKLTWACPKGHSFPQSLAKVVARKSCPKCYSFYGEELCRFYFESIFKSKFPKTRPEFLKRRKGVYLELDGYNEKLGIAFEHHGEQHFKFNSKFHISKRRFKERQAADREKKRLCRRHNVKLIIIPAVPEYTSVEKLPSKIALELRKQKIKFQTKNIPQAIDFKYLSKDTRIDLLREVAIERGGKLVSDAYIRGRDKLRWRCNLGHTWSASTENILGSKSKKGTWCPVCASLTRNDYRRLTMDDMHKMAKAKDGKCLSTTYVNAGKKLLWQCKKKHKWATTPNSIQQGNWCAICAGRKVTIEIVRKWAKQYSGECLSKKYVNNTTRMKWRCKKNHIWLMSTGKLQRRLKESQAWCLDCRS